MTEKIKKIALFSLGIILAVSFAVNFLVYENMNNQIRELKEELKDINSIHDVEIFQRENEISSLKDEIIALKEDLSEIENASDNLSSKINDLETDIKNRNETIESLENEIESRQVEIDRLKKELSRYRASQNTNSGKSVYLTFDDGPSLLTPKVLDVLKEENVKATFFVVGTWVQKYPDIARRAQKEGHSVLCHTHTHQWSIYTSFDTYYNDLHKVENVLMNTLGAAPEKIIRFPGGSTNQASYQYGGVKFMNNLTNDIKNKGYYYIDWNVSSGDTGSGHNNKENIIANTKKWSAGRFLAVSLFHDVSTNKALVDALPVIIDYYRDNGFEFKNFNDISESDLQRMVDAGLANKVVDR